MNIKLLLRLLGILSLLIGFFMLASLIWSNPRFGFHTDQSIVDARFEYEGFRGLIYSTLISCAIGGLFLLLGRDAEGKLFRKEAMAVVGLSWVLATVLGALPFLFSGVYRGPSIRVFKETQQVFVVAPSYKFWQTWVEAPVTEQEFKVLEALAGVSARGLNRSQLQGASKLPAAAEVFQQLTENRTLARWLIDPRRKALVVQRTGWEKSAV